MAIESISGKTLNTVLPTKTNGKDAVGVKQQPTATVSKDTVDLTAVAQDIKSTTATGASADVPVINEERVAEIKTVVQAGDYQVNAERVAEKMMQFEVKLPGST